MTLGSTYNLVDPKVSFGVHCLTAGHTVFVLVRYHISWDTLTLIWNCIQRFRASLVAFVLSSCYSDWGSTRMGEGGGVPGEVLVHQSGPRLAPGGSSGQALDRSAQGLVGGPQGGPAPWGNSSGRWESPRQCPTSGPQNNVVVKRLCTIRLLVSAQAN